MAFIQKYDVAGGLHFLGIKTSLNCLVTNKRFSSSAMSLQELR